MADFCSKRISTVIGQVSLMPQTAVVIVFKNFLNPQRHQNPINGSKVTVILLNGWILPIGKDSAGSAINRATPSCLLCDGSIQLKHISFFYPLQAGIPFNTGDILQIISKDDHNWWQVISSLTST